MLSEFNPYAKELAQPSALGYYSALLSHSSVDKDSVRRLYGNLFDDNKVSCWLDEHQSAIGQSDRGDE